MTHKVKSHVWWNADRSALVPTGSPDAAFLAYAAGDDITDDEARRAGLLSAEPVLPVAAPVAAPDADPAAKMRAGRAANKLGARPATKDEETL